jgi:hypothetical protein
MDGITSALAAQQSLYQDQIGLVAMKQAAQNQQQMAAMLAQAAQQAAVNPAHLGQNIDTYA